MAQELILKGEDFFAELLRSIHLAQFEVSGVFYIFKNDRLGQAVLTELVAAKARGVRVRWIVDGVGSMDAESWLRASLKDSLRVYHPVRFGFSHFSKLNQRCHLKLLIIDQKTIFSGSRNIDAVHAFNWNDAAVEWKDLGIRIEGTEQVSGSVQLFEMLWKGRILLWKTLPHSMHARGSFFHRFNYYRRFIGRVISVDGQFRAVTAYFVPRRSFFMALLFLKSRKVNVEIIIPQHTDHPFTRWIAEAYIERLIEEGVRVFSYPHHFLHAKAIAFDREVWVGSTNLNYRSFHHDLELDFQLSDPLALESWESFWQKLREESNEWTLERLRKVPLWERLLGRMLLRFRYWC